MTTQERDAERAKRSAVRADMLKLPKAEQLLGYVGKFTAYTKDEVNNMAAAIGVTPEQIRTQCSAHDGSIDGGKHIKPF